MTRPLDGESGRAVGYNKLKAQDKEQTVKPAATLNVKVSKVSLMHYAQIILRNLSLLKQNALTPATATPALAIIKGIREMRSVLPSEPYLQIALALHDALNYDNRWTNYSDAQYATAYDVMKEAAIAANNDRFDMNALSKMIERLEKAGFATLPFDWDFEEVAEEE